MAPPPPPAQKGKFRPKKAPTKIRPPTAGAAAGGGPVPDAAISAPVQFAPASRAGSGGRGGEGGGGGRDGGRGGRGGRDGRGGRGGGRGRRAPIASGRTFFTGGEKKSATPAGGKKKRNLDKLGLGGGGKKDDPTEEIVDYLDAPIGPSSSGKDIGTRILDRMDYLDQGFGDDDGGDGGNNYVVDGAMYDSDSSREEARGGGRKQGHHHHHAKTKQPSQLPFPQAPLPIGVGGGTERRQTYAVPKTNNKNGGGGATMAVSTPDESTSGDAITGSSASPFVSLTQTEDLDWEYDNWFLVQMPTRLPPLKPKIALTPIDNDDGDENAGGGTTEEASGGEGGGGGGEVVVPDIIAEVATPPLIADGFDNTLSRTAPGRIGKIVVYKSGKTVLIMDSPDGSKQVKLNVHEGLSCGFVQQAVAVDLEKAEYIGLGDVIKSVVVSPDLGSSM